EERATAVIGDGSPWFVRKDERLQHTLAGDDRLTTVAKARNADCLACLCAEQVGLLRRTWIVARDVCTRWEKKMAAGRGCLRKPITDDLCVVIDAQRLKIGFAYGAYELNTSL